jgi:hypothetical protein
MIGWWVGADRQLGSSCWAGTGSQEAMDYGWWAGAGGEEQLG